jgi:lysozyme family protein
MIDIPSANIFDSVALPLVLSYEGGFNNDPVDKGGATNKGITQATYDTFRLKQGEYSQDVRLITDAEVRSIYYEWYWLQCKCDLLMYPLNVAVFDFNVNSGANAAKVLQRMLSLTDDGIIGKDTIHAVALKTPDTQTTVAFTKEYVAARKQYYKDIVTNKPSQHKFYTGWMNRCNDFIEKFLN